MEDNGYYSRRPSEFTLPWGSSSSGKILTAEDFFELNLADLESSPTYRYFRHGFKDEGDFDEFKRDLLDFWKLKQEFQDDFNLNTYDDLSRSCEVTRFGRHRKNRDCLSRRQWRGSDVSASSFLDKHKGEESRTSEQNSSLAASKQSPIEQFPCLIGTYSEESSVPKSEDFFWEFLYPLIPNPCTVHPPDGRSVSTRREFSKRSGLCVSGCDFLCSKSARISVSKYLGQTYKSLEARQAQNSDSLMEFFSGDEHFQEFERVFNTVHDRRSLRLSRDMDRRGTSGLGMEGDDLEGGKAARLSLQPSATSSVFEDQLGAFSFRMDASFLDFFDNDEDFKEFERELETFKYKRGSRVLEELKRVPSCDIFTDVKKFCDRKITSTDTNARKRVSEDEDSRRELEEEQTDKTDSMWKSVKEWDFVLNKLKRNSRIFTDPLGTSHSEEFTLASDETQKKQKSWRDTWSEREQGSCAHKDDCQYTCHHHCLTAVALDCTTEGTGEEEETLVSRGCGGSDLETSLSDPSLSKRTPTQKLATSSLQLQRSSPELVRVPGSAQPVSPQLLLQAPTVTPTPVVTLRPESTSPTPAYSPAAEGDTADSNTNEKDETDSGYRSGTIPDDKLPKHADKALLNCKELQFRLEQFNTYLPAANLELNEDGHSFQGFIKVNLNLIRPITMSLSVQPPSFYELLTQEHIVEQNTQSMSFYMPRDTVKSIHVQSTTTTREVITVLLKKFHILDHPRKFAMYEQEVNKTKIVKLRRVKDNEFPLVTCLSWNIESPNRHRLVLQENETGEIQWDAFSLPELSNFLRVLDREEEESIAQLKHKYSVMKRIMLHRLKELRKERKASASVHHSAS